MIRRLTSPKLEPPRSGVYERQEKNPYIYVNVHGAEGLNFDSHGKVYCELITNNNRITTSTIKCKANPKWREEFLMEMSNTTLCLEVEIWVVPHAGGVRRSQIFPRRNTRTKGEKILYGVVSINLGVVHAEEGSLVEDWFRIRKIENNDLTDLPIHDLLVDKRVKRRNDTDPTTPLSNESWEKIYLGIQLFKQAVGDSICSYDSVVTKMQEPKYVRFNRLLVNDNMNLIALICNILDPSDSDKFAPPLVRLFDFFGKIRPLWRHLLQMEVDGSENSQVLFRSNSMAIKVVSIYGKMAGLTYLQRVLGPVVREIMAISNPEDYEMDPNKLKYHSGSLSPGRVTVRNSSSLHGLSAQTQAKLTQNSQRLKKVTSTLFTAIIESRETFPSALRAICSDIADIVAPKFPTFTTQALASFVSLRFFQSVNSHTRESSVHGKCADP